MVADLLPVLVTTCIACCFANHWKGICCKWRTQTLLVLALDLSLADQLMRLSHHESAKYVGHVIIYKRLP